ncbi:hypothetical protein SAMN04488512_1123 [Sulfitobacter litoralis]|uniref:Uncharacterized protein n=2 Tax=Sulfitobacter litoralis TaxID=335975 RepID=A0ABY0SHR1_9RHOB|nr:hypothetical protein SAMN04488512_1123 [Sulfitobacter litoralis]
MRCELAKTYPMGIPLDTQEKRGAGASMLMQAKNAFLDKIISDCSVRSRTLKSTVAKRA